MVIKTPDTPKTAEEKGTMQVQRQFDPVTANRLESMPISEIRQRLGIEEEDDFDKAVRSPEITNKLKQLDDLLIKKGL